MTDELIDSQLAAELVNQSTQLLAQFERSGDMAAVDEAITKCHRAVLAGRNDPNLPLILVQLSLTLRTRFTHLGTVADLEAAVQASRTALDVTSREDRRQAAVLTNLSNNLQTRFRLFGDAADLLDAIGYAISAVDATPENDPDLFARQCDLGGALMARFDLLGDLKALDGAISAVGRAVRDSPDDHADHPLFLNNLAGALATKAQMGDTAALGAAVEAAEDAVVATSGSEPRRAVFLSTLCSVLQLQHDLLGDPQALDGAIDAGRTAAEALPVKSGQRAAFLNNLGNALHSRFEHSRAPSDAADALSAWKAAVATDSPAEIRIGAAQAWGDFSSVLERWAEAAQGYASMVSLLPLLTWHGLGRTSRELSLARWSSVAVDATATAIRADRPQDALKQAELGRAVLWSQTLHLNTDAQVLHAVAPKLAERLVEIRTALDRVGVPDN